MRVLLVPQDGILVVQLQVLRGGGGVAIVSAAALVLHDLKRLVDLAIPGDKSDFQNGKRDFYLFFA